MKARQRCSSTPARSAWNTLAAMDTSAASRRELDDARRIVVKIGTSSLTNEDGGLALSRVYSFVESIAALRRGGREVLLVTSGAIGLGVARLGVERHGMPLPLKQACAAVGQGRLMALYSDAFDRLGLAAAQVLLTEEDFHNRRRYLNLRSTLSKLLELGAVPVINENDTVSTAELEVISPEQLGAPPRRVNFGDNDKLSALVASKIEADLLVILTDVDGLYDADPRAGGATLIERVESLTPEITALAGGARAGRGGMRTKLEAARIATQSGCATVVANGRLPQAIDRVLAGEPLGTLFVAQSGLAGRGAGKRRWIAFATTVEAAIVVNAGARRALVEGKASLLPAGLVEVRGHFARGDVVSILDADGSEFARGLMNYASDEAQAVLGQSSQRLDDLVADRNYDALVTRDNIALLPAAAPAKERA